MLSDVMQTALNEHLNMELYSSYLYLSMAAHFEDADLPGLAHWMEAQAHEELFHVMRVYRFLNERGGRVLLTGVQGPKTKWATPVEVFAEALAHEQAVSHRVNKLVDLALSESDHPTNNFLQWFVGEQVEEEASVKEVLQKVRMVADSAGSMFILDQELARRPAPVAPAA